MTQTAPTSSVASGDRRIPLPDGAREPLKVNDKDGTPIEIAAVVLWKVVNPAEAVFSVDDFEEFVKVQGDAALRNLASRYSYDAPDADQHSLRAHIEEVAGQLKSDLLERFLLFRRALDPVLGADDLDVVRRRLEHVRGVAPGLVLDLVGRLDRGRAPDR